MRGAGRALLSVLLAFCIVLRVSGSLAYLIERGSQPQVFSSIPAALWWAITTLTTTGYGDVTPLTPLGRMLAGIVLGSGILVFALWAGLRAPGFPDEKRRPGVPRTWGLDRKDPVFHAVC